MADRYQQTLKIKQSKNPSVALTPSGLPINYAMELTGKEQVGTSMGNNFDMNSVKDYGNPTKADLVDRYKRKTTAPEVVDTSKFKVGGGYYGYTPLQGVGGYQPSEAYNQAMAYTQSLLDKLNTGRTDYSDKVDSMMARIEGRDKFQYDFNTDPLFQNALASAVNSGQNAMQDTIGQASALTGGYGSSYATSAANQAYNSFIEDAYSNLPQYYQIAKDAYDTETADMYNQLGMYSDADERAYGRLSNAYNLNYGRANDEYNKGYQNYWDTNNYNLNVAEYNNDQAYKAASLAQDAAEFNAKMEYQLAQDKANMEYQLAQDKANASAKASADAYAIDDANNQMTLKASDVQKIVDAYNDGGADTFWRMADTYPNLSDADLLFLDERLQEIENSRINTHNANKVKAAKDNR